MAANQTVSDIYQASSKLAKFPFEPYWPQKKLKICITGAGGFIARYGMIQFARIRK
jgi:GDP-D-mannose 3',5'-epimerase